MKFNIVSNLTNGVGLSQDYAMLRAELEARGHQVNGIQFNGPGAATAKADVNIFLEVVTAKHFPLAGEQWLVPNPEWFFWPQLMSRFTRVLTKTKDAHSIFAPLARRRAQYIGWRARDLYQAELPRKKRFLHLAGKSPFKNTEAVLECWRRYRPPAHLEVVSHRPPETSIAGVTFHGRLEDPDLVSLVNSCQFHLMPSAYEGFGHALHEGLGVGAVIITTNAAPMNEIPAAVLVPFCCTRRHHFGQLRRVTPEAVRVAVHRALEMKDERIAQERVVSRAAFLQESDDFRRNLDAVLDDAEKGRAVANANG